jgi:hypothetical protein
VLRQWGDLRAGRGDGATALYEQSLEISRAIQRPYEEALALHGLGRCETQVAETRARGVTRLEAALQLFNRLGAVRAAAGVRASLGSLVEGSPERT